jgi:hypothetical protein
MKKLIVLVAALLLIGTAAFAQMMSDVTISGEVETRWLNDYTNKAFEQNPEVIVGVNATVDENSSVYIELEEGPRAEFTGTSDATFPFDKAYFTLDLGGIFDLPVGVTVRTGFDEYDPFDAAKVTFGEWEDVIGTDAHAWGNEINVAATEQVAIRVLWANDFALKQFAAGVAVTYDPIYVETSFVTSGEDASAGSIESGAEFAMDVADGINVGAAVTMYYDLEDATTTDSLWKLGAAVTATYNDMATLGVAFRGMTDSEVNSLQIDLSAMPTEMVGVFVAVGLGLDDAVYPEMLDSIEGSVQVMLGPSTWYFGVISVTDSARTGAIIAREKSDFVTPANDSLSAFVRGELKY